MGKSAIGYQFERELVAEFKEHGYITIRSAASKVIDVVAISDSNIFLIEAKRTRQKTPRSYGTEIYNLMLMRRTLRSSNVTMIFWIRLHWKKDLVLEVHNHEVEIYRRFTTCDMEMANAFCKRKNKMLKEK